jgi:hypothetical protein
VKTIWLEFKHENGALAANGSDVTFYIDGRWSPSTTKRQIWGRVAELRAERPKYRDQLFVGYSVAGHSNMGVQQNMGDLDPPAWARPEKKSEPSVDYVVRFTTDEHTEGRRKVVSITPGFSTFEDIRKIIAVSLWGKNDAEYINRIRVWSVMDYAATGGRVREA